MTPATGVPPLPEEEAIRGHRRPGSVVRRYPIPFVALAGLAAGAVLTYLVGQGGIGDDVWLGTLLVGGLPLGYQTARRLWHGEFASDVIAMLAIVGAIALDQAFAGVIIVLMQSGGEALDSYAFQRASASLRALLDRAPRIAQLRRGDRVEPVPVDRVEVGEILLVRTGDLVPVDGVVLGPPALLDESTISGEPLPRRRAIGEEVLSGTANVGPPFDLRAERRSGESQYAQIVALVRSAQQRKPPIQRLADRYAVWFTPLTLLVAAFGGIFTHNPDTALAVLVVATPCPLLIATPIAVVGGVNRAAKRGLVVKNGGAIEELGRARVVLFDKTGTLTSGQPELRAVVPIGAGRSVEELVRPAAALEELSSHPLAAAVVRRAREMALPPATVHGAGEAGGAGVEGSVEGHRVLVGSAGFVRTRLGRAPPPVPPELDERTAGGAGRMVSYVAIDGDIAGILVFADRLRDGVPAMVARLRSAGVERIGMITGDSRSNAAEIARLTGISEWSAELTPQGKVERVRGYRHEFGSVVMVGDGVNDAAALAAASVGVAMGARGAGISTEAADIVLLVDDVTRVADGIELGQRMVGIARQGILFGLGASAVLMAIAAVGGILPAVGAVLQEAIDVAVIFNALRVR